MSLRDRKRARTRRAIIDAATELFEQHGYAETTVAEIAAKAEIGTRTFFSYFASKEELLFPDAEARVQAALDAIASHAPDEGPTEVLMRALRTIGADSDDMTSLLATMRLRLVRTVPAVRGYGLRLQLDAQNAIARELAGTFPDRLDPVTAAALTGAFVGAIQGALQVLLADNHDDPQAAHKAMVTATEIALSPWRDQLKRL